MRLERRVQVREEGGDVRREALLERGGERTDDEEGVLEEGRRLARSIDELEQEGHDAVGQGLDAVVELADDALQRGERQDRQMVEHNSQ